MFDNSIFKSARLSIDHAKFRNLEIDTALLAYLDSNPCAVVTEPYGDGSQQVTKMKVVKPVPPIFSFLAFESLNWLRMALDQATYAIAVADGKTGNNAHFPFGDTRAEIFASYRGKGSRSGDIRHEIFDYMMSFEPYKGGYDFLWAMNKFCNSHKHEFISPLWMMVGSMQTGGQSIPGLKIRNPPVWDRLKNEMELFITPRDAHYPYNFKFHAGISFADVEVFDGYIVGSIFNICWSKVESIINGLEAECRRMGIPT